MKSPTLAILGLLACSPAVHAAVTISTATGNGADTYLTNDSNRGPAVVNGNDGSFNIRNVATNVRSRQALLRFDFSDYAAPGVADTTLTLNFTASNRTRTVRVYGLTDESLDNWAEASTSYVNAPGSNYDADTNVLGSFSYDIFDSDSNPTGVWTLLGTFNIVNAAGLQSSVPTQLPLDDFLNGKTNGLASFLIVSDPDANADWFITSKEGDPALAPSLTFNLIPEPSTALLAALGACGLLRRRR